MGILRTSFFSFIVVLFALVFTKNIYAQLELPEDKVSWSFSVEQNGDEATVIGKITMVKNWHIYGAYLPKGSYLIPTKVDLVPSSNFQLVGKLIEPKPVVHRDEITGEDLLYHSNTIYLKQKIKVTSEKDFVLKGKFSFQTCDDEKCLPPHEADFSVKVKGVKKDNLEGNVEVVVDPVVPNDTVEKNENPEPILEQGDEEVKNQKENENPEPKKSLWGIFWISFGAGFLILFTPCVFPMIPMTVSFFTHQSPTKAKGIRNSVIYMLSIISIFMILGLALVAIFGDAILHVLSTNVWFNLAFFIILAVLAISFLGAFEIRMPSKWINKADKNADKGGVIGIFFMALVLVLVSFSCTGPALAFIVSQAASSGGMTPIVGMLGFSLALALPFGLFAAFPGWLNSMPKSGGWLNVVKVVLGFIELAFAFKFLSNADLAIQAHLLEREVFVAIWVAIFVVLGIYLLGKIKLPHDSPVEGLSVGRTLLATLSFAFAFYMLPGIWGGPVKLINAFAPPRNYSEFAEKKTPINIESNIKYHPEMHLGPQDIMVFDDYDTAKKYAKEVGKPLMVDYTGYNCVNCRKMEESVWGEAGVIEILRDKVIIVSLHQDDGRLLPKSEQGEMVLDDGRKISVTTIGDKWRAKQIKEHNILSQPYYLIENNEGDIISNGAASFATHRSKEVFQKWLEEGLKSYKASKQ